MEMKDNLLTINRFKLYPLTADVVSYFRVSIFVLQSIKLLKTKYNKYMPLCCLSGHFNLRGEAKSVKSYPLRSRDYVRNLSVRLSVRLSHSWVPCFRSLFSNTNQPSRVKHALYESQNFNL